MEKLFREMKEGVESFKAKYDEKFSQVEKALQRSERLALGGGSYSDPKNSEHAKALVKYILRGDDAGLRAYQASVNITDDPSGGFAVPEELDKNVSRLLANASPMRSVSTVVPVSTSDYRKLVTTTRAGASHVTEASPRPETTSPALASLSPSWSEIYAAPQLSQYALDDFAFDALAWLESEVVEAFAETENVDFTTGSGAPGYPKGILSYDATDEADSARDFGKLQYIPSGDASAFIAPTAVAGPGDCLFSLIYATKAAHRKNGIFMMNKNTLGMVRGFRDYITGNYLWQPGLAGQPSTLCGYNVVENEAFPDVGGDAFPIAFGNFKCYQIVDRLGMRVLRDPYTAKPATVLYCYRRFGNLLLDSQGIKLLKIAAS